MPVKTEITALYNETCSLVVENRLKEAMLRLGKLMEGLSIADFTLQYENLDQTYRMMLEYTFRGVPDPQRERVYNSLKISILELADRVHQKALEKTGMNTFSLKVQLEKDKEPVKEDAVRSFDTHSFDRELERILAETELDPAGDRQQAALNQITPKLFQLIWLSDKYTETDIRLIESIRISEELPWYEKCLAVSALTLSLLNCFDKEKFLMLFRFYELRQHEVWQRALTAIVIAIFYYNKRIDLYPVIGEKIAEHMENEQFYEDVRQVLIALFKALETEKVTKKFQQEISPDIQKIEEKIREKIDLDNILESDFIEDKNPDWEMLFEDSPGLLDKIEKMSNMQMDGVDLFMGTFAMLKHFDFFRDISNWFRPFYKENESARNAVISEGEKAEAFLEGMENSFYMCNSDKYSFCFNISHLPANQRNGIINLFNMEAESLRELKQEEDLLASPRRDLYVFNQYIQDLYRFYKLHPFRADFRDIFALDWDIEGSVLFGIISKSKPLVKDLAEFLFEKERYTGAIPLLQYLCSQPEPSGDLIGKLAYSYQRTGDFENALEYYRQSELFDINRLWSVRKIIFCLRQSGKFDEALNWCNEALAIDPDDVYINTMAGNCLFDLKRFPEALEHYFKVEFLAPGNKKILRPIAWCSLVSGKMDIAGNYLRNILELEPTASDFINAGHVEFCRSSKPKAIEYYTKALNQPGMNMTRFARVLRADAPILEANGVKAEEITLLLDYLRYLL